MSKKPTIKFEYLDFQKLVFLENNPRTRTEAGLEKNAGIDRGDIERQEMAWIDPAHYSGSVKDNAAEIWREQLLPMGVRLMAGALADIKAGIYSRTAQDARFSTFEPSLDAKDIFKPDLLGIEAKCQVK